MTGSSFTPAGGETKQSGSTVTPPDAGPISSLPDTTANPPSSSSGLEVSAENDGRLLVIKMSGKLHKSDYAHFVPVVEQAVQKHGKVRMLVRMHDFHGWDAGALWEDVKFDVKHFNKIERLAIIGETTWEKWMAMFCKPFTTASIRYFPSEKAAEAREWVAG